MNEHFYEIINEDLTKSDFKNNYPHFMKYAYKYKNKDKYSGFAYRYKDKRYNRIIMKNTFPFFDEMVHKKIRTSVKYGDYPLEYYKVNKSYYNFYSIQNENIKFLERISNIRHNKNDERDRDYIDSLIPGSFMLCQEFELLSPYFSKDDDEFYIISNPILKEKVFKVPMIRGSIWKGCLLDAAFKILNETIKDNSSTIEQIIDKYTQIYRIFGTGSEEFRNLKDVLIKYIKIKSDNGISTVDELEKHLLKYALFDLGISLNLKNKYKPLIDQLIDYIDGKIKSSDFEGICVRKGRAVFYPTYFNRITLEVINPHNRETKAGTSPIYYEVVPKGTKGYLQIIYIPFDSVFLPESKIIEQVKNDINFLKEVINKALTENGIGAKTKLGWGYAELEESKVICNLKGV